MTTVRFYIDADRAGRLFRRATDKAAKHIRDAVRKAAADTAADIQDFVRDDIQAAGRFGDRWTEGFKVNVTEGGGNIRVESNTEDMPPYWRIFETGGTIKGNPMLWIPLSGSDGAGISAKNYPGRLFRVDRKAGGAPLLLVAGKPARPVYFGKESVYEPKKFHVEEIIRERAQTVPKRVKANLAGGD